MTRYTDRGYLQGTQYQDESNLEARASIHQSYSIHPQSYEDWLYEHINLPPNGNVLDLGCGPGTMWNQAGKRLQHDIHLIMADFSPGMIFTARRRLQVENRCSYYLADAVRLPYADDCLDIVIANFILHHVADVRRAHQGIRRVLKPGGRFYAVTHGPRHMRRVREIIAALDPDADLVFRGAGFDLENGTEKREQLFGQVERHVREDALLVAHVESLVDTILSTGQSPYLKDHTDLLATYLQALIAAEGAIHIEKEIGLFRSA